MRKFRGPKQLFHDQRGATAIEYGLILALIALAMMAALGTLADETISMWGHVEQEVTTVMD